MMNNFLKRSLFLVAALISQAVVSGQVNDTAVNPYWIDMMQDQNANFYQTQAAFETYWSGREITKGSGYKPFKRWEYMMEQRVDAQGVKPAPDRDLNAYNRIIEQGSVLRNPAGNWMPLGPFTVPSGYNGYRGLGRVNAIGFDPVNPDILYIGAPAGGLWVSYNHGGTWQVLTDHLPTLGVSAVLVDRTNPATIYIGTGDRDAGDAPGLGIWRSTDGGQNWEVWSIGIGSATVGRIVQDAVDPLVLLAAVSNGLYRSSDGGATWERVRTGNFKEVVFHPTNNMIVYAASGANFYRSEDNGLTFNAITNGLTTGARAVIGVSPASPDVVYCLITNSESFKGIYRSTDTGLSFEMRSNSPNIMSWDCNGGDGGQAWYDLDIAVDPLNADNVLAGGVNSFRSLDGGINWTIRSHWYGGCGVQSVHADLHVLEYSPVNNRLYVGNDGGFYWTANGGVNWTEISNGLVISQAYKIGQSKTKPNFVINGYQDNGSSVLNNTNWFAVGGGDGMECTYDPNDERYSYSSIYYGAIDRQFNNNNQGAIAGEGTNGITEGGGWVTPYLIDHNDGNIMFIGYKNVWRSTNIKANSTGSVQWQKISSINNSNMSQMAQSKANTNILYVSAGNKLFMTENAKATIVDWKVRTSTLPTNNTITAIETHPSDENVLYIAQQSRIFKSSDKGVTWEEKTSNLSGIQINSIAFYKNSQEGLYIGTDIGVFYREASMDEWMLFSEGLPASVKVTEVEIYYDPINPINDAVRAGTYGRGLWTASPFIGTVTAGFVPSANTVSAGCFVNFTDQTIGTPFTWEWTFEGGNPSTSSLQHPQGIIYETEGVFDVTLTVTNSLGSSSFIYEDCITVGPASTPQIAFDASTNVGCVGLVVRFTDQTEHCPTFWVWDFTPSSVTYLEGTNNASQNPVVQFNANTHYDVRLTASNANGVNTLLKSGLIEIGGYSLPFIEDFEDLTLAEKGWTISNPDNGKTWTTQQLPDGNKAVWMNFFNYTSFQQRDYLMSPPLDFTGFQQPGISFEYAYAQRFAQIDSLIISVSSDCGQTWQRVYANGPDGQGIFETAPPSISSFVPQSVEDWCLAGSYGASCPEINLSAFAGLSGVKIRFETYNQYGNNLYIDNFAVTTITDVNENDALSEGMELYPNPATDKVQLHISPELIGKTIVIADAQAKVVKKVVANEQHFEISLQGLRKGVYTISVLDQQKVIRKLLVK